MEVDEEEEEEEKIVSPWRDDLPNEMRALIVSFLDLGDRYALSLVSTRDHAAYAPRRCQETPARVINALFEAASNARDPGHYARLDWFLAHTFVGTMAHQLAQQWAYYAVAQGDPLMLHFIAHSMGAKDVVASGGIGVMLVVHAIAQPDVAAMLQLHHQCGGVLFGSLFTLAAHFHLWDAVDALLDLNCELDEEGCIVALMFNYARMLPVIASRLRQAREETGSPAMVYIQYRRVLYIMGGCPTVTQDEFSALADAIGFNPIVLSVPPVIVVTVRGIPEERPGLPDCVFVNKEMTFHVDVARVAAMFGAWRSRLYPPRTEKGNIEADI